MRGIADSNILIELYRRNPLAIQWFSTQQNLYITSITWLEVMEGSRGRIGQARNLEIIDQFGLVYLTTLDQKWAMQKLNDYRLSHGVTFADCLIASVCYRLNVPLFTRNINDFLPILDSNLIIRPY